MSDSLWPHGLYSSWNSPGQNIGVSSHSLLQGSNPRSNPRLPHCRWILYFLSHQGSKNLPAMQETWIWFLGQEDPLENEMALQYAYLENPVDRGAWRVTVHDIARFRHDLVTKPPPNLCTRQEKWASKFYLPPWDEDGKGETVLYNGVCVSRSVVSNALRPHGL